MIALRVKSRPDLDSAAQKTLLGISVRSCLPLRCIIKQYPTLNHQYPSAYYTWSTLPYLKKRHITMKIACISFIPISQKIYPGNYWPAQTVCAWQNRYTDAPPGGRVFLYLASLNCYLHKKGSCFLSINTHQLDTSMDYRSATFMNYL